jgi:hypothetical protein
LFASGSEVEAERSERIRGDSTQDMSIDLFAETQGEYEEGGHLEIGYIKWKL